MSKKKLFNENWYFAKRSVNTTLEEMKSNSIPWEPVSLPHDWLIYDSNNLYESSDGWYRKELKFSDLYKKSRISIRFEGVYMNSELYVNGNAVGTWKYGYSTFEFDITDFLVLGNNEILVQVVYEAPNSRWYSGAGIYRNVWLKSYPDTHIVADGIYISTKNQDNKWEVDISTEIEGTKNMEPSSTLKLRNNILDINGLLIAQAESPVAFDPKNSKTIIHSETLKVTQPNLWDIKSPAIYKLQTQLLLDNAVIEEEIQTFGFRTLEFNSQKGFFLNGNYVKIHGVCQHHDLGCLGAAVNKEAIRRQISLLQEMGVNSIRTTHNMPAVELMELANEMGILIVSEAFDMWERKKTTYDYARFFPDWVSRDVRSWIRRDRNHPSLIMWSIGNEIYDTHADERGQEITRMLRDLVLEHDPKGNAPITLGSNYMPWENAQKCADILKLAGYNYAEKYYEKHHKEHPDWIIYGSETSSTVQSRGIYHFPLAQSVLSDDDEQCSSLGNSSTSWGAKNTESCIIDDRDAVYSPGQYIWTGFDYIGEPTPYFTKNSYFGQIDTAGFKKDSFYIYQSEWTNYKINPMIHIFPYWDFSAGQIIDIRVCSNAPKIELFFNNKSQGTVCIDHAHGKKLLGEWQIPYSKGELHAIAYDENNQIIAEDQKASFGDAVSLQLTPSKTELSANGSDLIFVEISAFDANKNAVENANNRVHISVDGPGCLVGLDNGDSTDYDQYKGTSRKMFGGKLLAVISSMFKAGDITLRVESKGLESKEITLQSMADNIVEGSCEPMDCPESDCKEEVPVRKLEIVSLQGNQLTKEKNAVNVHVNLYPKTASDQEVEWRVTNAAGIDSNIASIEANGKEAKLTAQGDGKVYIRCAVKNGTDKINIYSLLEFSITGLGQADLNPYEFISAANHTYSSQNLTNGNERGIATSREGESRVGFHRINFGDYGSDEILIPIFSLDNEEFPIEIWEGMPDDENASLLTCVTYQKPSKWNVYQEVTYKLPKRLKGITSLCFVLHRKIHIKGFLFKKYEKAFQQISVLENNKIYGDTFTITDTAIENIGNNVSIEFEHMDFGDDGCSKLTICGHSPLDKNTIHIQLTGLDGEVQQLVDFAYSEDYCEREYSLTHITGLKKVIFVFLPGCQFDFKWFRFQ